MPAVTNIPGLPAAISVNGTEELWAVQNGRDVRLTSAQIASLGGGGGSGGGNVPANLVPSNGVLIASGTSAIRVVDPGVSGQVLTSNGAGIPPTYQAAPSGTVAGGGTGLNSVPAGDLLAGNGVNPLLLIDPGTTGQVLTSNGPGVPPSMQNAASSSGTVPQGGTGRATLAIHGVLIGQGAAAINVTTPGTAGQVLTSNGAGADPTFQAVPTPVIDVPHGGTGVATLFAHGLLVGNGTGVVQVTSPGTAGQVLTSNGAGADPTMQNLAVTVVQGGTGVSTLTNHGVVIGQGTAAVHITAAGTAGQALLSNGASADPSFQTIPIPNVDVPHGGTGVATLTNHGVVIGQGAAAVHITSAGTLGQALISNGAGADPTFQAVPYPPLPVPNMQTFLQAAADAGVFADWIWGDYTTTTPIVVTINDNRNDIGVDFHGAAIHCAFTDATKDLVTYIVPTTATFAAQIQGLRILNGTFWGDNAGGAGCRNSLMISCPSHDNGIFGINVISCHTHTATNSGLEFYGAVFEADIIGHFARNNGFAGIELRNPAQGTGGVISSVNIFGGDLRVNHHGLALTADIAFQEPSGVYVHSTNFIANDAAGISAVSGIQMVFGCHFENNCELGVQNAGVVIAGGGNGSFLRNQAVHSNSNAQLHLANITGGGGRYIFEWNEVFNEDTFGFEFTAQLSGAGTIWTSPDTSAADYTGAGWTIKVASHTETPST